MMQTNATIFVVDDDESMRTALSRLLRSAGYQCEAFESAQAFLQRERHSGVGCLVLDLRMPHVTGLELQERLARLGYHLPIIFLTGHGDIPHTVQAVKHGAVNFLTKPVDEEVLLASIEEALVRGRQLLAAAKEQTAILQRTDTLSAREFEVMQGVIAGALNKQIAAHLGIAEKTVKIHRGQVMEKMKVNSVAELVRLCESAGIKPVAIPT
jgi:FixJ family two-component response regulator